MTTDTIFNPKDDTLKERFSSFEYVNTCYHRDKANLNKTNDFLGDSNEIKDAYALSRESLKQAHRSISEGVIDNTQVKNFKQSKNMLEMEAKRETDLSTKHKLSNKNSL